MNIKQTNNRNGLPTKKDIILAFLSSTLSIGLIIVCFLHHNWAKQTWLFILGWIILIVGFLPLMMTYSAFLKKTSKSKYKDWVKGKVVVNVGIYGVVRHPMYLSFMLIIIALIFISQHWLSVIFGIPIILYLYYSMIDEEKSNIEKFGDDYKRYMQKVPRANFLLGIIRPLQHKRKET